MLLINSTRFGTIQATEDCLIRFDDGMVGLPHLNQYVLVESPSMPLVLWMQAVNDPQIAFPLIEPYFFRKDYKPSLSPADACSIAFEQNDKTKTFVVLTIPQDALKMTVNLKAPVVINLDKGVGTQVILQDKTYEVRVPAFQTYEAAMNAGVAAISASVEEEEVWTEETENRWNVVNLTTRKDPKTVVNTPAETETKNSSATNV